CGIKTDGTLACWGFNSDGQAAPPDGSFTQVSAGFYHTCGVTTSGRWSCWGRNNSGQSTSPGAPTITTEPSDLTVFVGNSATFSIVASSADTFSYQWSYSSDGTTFTPINGTTGSSYTIDSAALTDAGWYRVTIVSPSAEITSRAAKLDVFKGILTITASSATIGYGDTIPTITPSYSGFVDGDTAETALSTLPICGTTATSSSGVGIYPTTCSGAASSTYAITYVDGTLTIKGTITITASSATIAYGDAIPTITPSYSGFVNGDSPETALTTPPTCSTSATSSSLPDNYPTSCSGAVSEFYDITYATGTLTITQGSVTITSDPANSQSKAVASTGGTAGFTLKATITDGSGDLSTALPVTYTLTPIGPGSSYACPDSTGGGVTDGVLQSSCAFTGVAPNVYTLTISVASTTFSGSTTDTVTVIDSGLAFATGSGTVSHDGKSGKFLLTAEYKQGALSGMFRFYQGDLQLTSSDLTSFVVVMSGPDGPIAYVDGTATDQHGASYSFRLTVIDGGPANSRHPFDLAPAPERNQLGLTALDESGQPVAGLDFGPEQLSCGNVMIGSPTDRVARILGYTVGLIGWESCR
ncbi:MBG domain-containing protein, partial [Nitrolancea hollandica]|uniref:MBG domain-containing protein n=1 Tax=Nitrolancea hollandica TaxID=1206749 RepID=UPI00058D0DC3